MYKRQGLGTDDDRVGLLFACCHPALPPEARVALTLRAVVGLTTPQIARGLLIPESTLAQRIVRAKRKIVATGIRLQVPDARDLPSRLDDVLRVIYLASVSYTHLDVYKRQPARRPAGVRSPDASSVRGDPPVASGWCAAR